MKDIHYYSNYAESHDIDCFFKVNGVAYHFASNGHEIPEFILRNQNIKVQNAVYELLPNAKGECVVHEETIKKLLNQEQVLFNNNLVPSVDDNIDIDEMVKEYAASFVDMARLGFVSMDVDKDGRFCIIAEPKEGIPEEILEMLPEGWVDGLE